MPSFKQILVPFDWTEPSMRAFQLAASLARDQQAKLTLLYVVPLPVVMYGPPPENYLRHLREEMKCIDSIALPSPARCLVYEGAPAAAILNAAKEIQCDLIVMGTHGRDGFNRMLTGSVAEEVTRHAPCPVLTLNTKAPVNCSRPHNELPGANQAREIA